MLHFIEVINACQYEGGSCVRLGTCFNYSQLHWLKAEGAAFPNLLMIVPNLCSAKSIYECHKFDMLGNYVSCELCMVLSLITFILPSITVCFMFVCNFSRAQSQFLTIASQSKAPSSQSDIMKLLEPTSAQIMAVMNFFEKNRGSPYFNHLNAVSASIPALSWVTVVSVYQYLWWTGLRFFSRNTDHVIIVRGWPCSFCLKFPVLGWYCAMLACT